MEFQRSLEKIPPDEIKIEFKISGNILDKENAVNKFTQRININNNERDIIFNLLRERKERFEAAVKSF